MALGKPTQQSSTAHGGIASRAVDGSRNNKFSGNSCTHTDSDDTPWWMVDLKEKAVVVKVCNPLKTLRLNYMEVLYCTNKIVRYFRKKTIPFANPVKKIMSHLRAKNISCVTY